MEKFLSELFFWLDTEEAVIGAVFVLGALGVCWCVWCLVKFVKYLKGGESE